MAVDRSAFSRGFNCWQKSRGGIKIYRLFRLRMLQAANRRVGSSLRDLFYVQFTPLQHWCCSFDYKDSQRRVQTAWNRHTGKSNDGKVEFDMDTTSQVPFCMHSSAPVYLWHYCIIQACTESPADLCNICIIATIQSCLTRFFRAHRIFG